MKFGVLLHQNNVNIGDDIQAYAVAQFLPSVDYLIDRETLNSFVPEDGKPIAIPMCAWYMWRKWNWPPSDYIVPKLISMHYADHQLANQPGSTVKFEFLTGIGGEYLNTWGPVGTRDLFTKQKLEEVGVDCYFSGCVTSTIKQMPRIKNVKKYICLVDLDDSAVKTIEEKLANEDVEIKIFTHNAEVDSSRSWDERKAAVEERLTIYQNAVCIVTKRLHCALPCMAMEVPVLVVKQMENDIRFDPYYEWFHWVKTSDFNKGLCDYDLLNPPANKPHYLKSRELISKELTDFVNMYKDDERSVEEVKKTTYTEQELINWRHDVMKDSLDLFYRSFRAGQIKVIHHKRTVEKAKLEVEKVKRRNAELEEKIRVLESSTPMGRIYLNIRTITKRFVKILKKKFKKKK